MMSEKPEIRPKDKTIWELKADYAKLLRVREAMPGNADAMRDALKAEKAAKEQEMNAAKARALKPAMDGKAAALKKANEENQAALQRIKQAFDDEIKPAVTHRDALIAEAQKDLNSKVQTAKLAFNDAASELHKDLIVELEEIAKKNKTNIEQLEKQYGEQLSDTDVQLDKLKTAIDRLEAQREAAAEAAKPKEKPEATA
jgi:hypothetical protein